MRGGWPLSDIENDGTSSGQNPLFADPPDDLWLLSKPNLSPGIDAGNSEIEDLPDTDLDGNPRIVDGDGDGTAAIDLGAYESQP